MKIRVIQDPDGVAWTVERREWALFVFPRWVRQEIFTTYGFPSEFTSEQRQAGAKQEAIDYATRLANPEIVNIK